MNRAAPAGMDHNRWLQLERTVRFGDTDAAGVMHFLQLLRWCHEAYEESLEGFGVSAASLFPGPRFSSDPVPEVALPIAHCQADFRRPLLCGDRLQISLEPRRIDPGSFEVSYRFTREGQPVASGLTRHVAVLTTSGRRCALPETIQRWLEAASLSQGVQPL